MKAKELVLVVVVIFTILFSFNIEVSSYQNKGEVKYTETVLNMDHEVWVFENGEWWIYLYGEDGGIIAIYKPPND